MATRVWLVSLVVSSWLDRNFLKCLETVTPNFCWGAFCIGAFLQHLARPFITLCRAWRSVGGERLVLLRSLLSMQLSLGMVTALCTGWLPRFPRICGRFFKSLLISHSPAFLLKFFGCLLFAPLPTYSGCHDFKQQLPLISSNKCLFMIGCVHWVSSEFK